MQTKRKHTSIFGRAGAAKGLSAWVAVSSGKPLLDQRAKPYVFTHVIPGMFTSAVGMFSAGTSFRWVRDNIFADLASRGDGSDPYALMTALAEQSPVGAKWLLFNPSMAGGSSLDASPNVRGAFLGLDLGHSRADVARAAMEGIALGLRLLLDELRKLSPICDEMVAVGGSSRSRLWRQIFADTGRIKIIKTNVGQEAGALGAAAVAAVGAGLWSDFARIDEVHQVEEVAAPIAENAAIYERLLPIFRQAGQDQARLGDMLAGL